MKFVKNEEGWKLTVQNVLKYLKASDILQRSVDDYTCVKYKKRMRLVGFFMVVSAVVRLYRTFGASDVEYLRVAWFRASVDRACLGLTKGHWGRPREQPSLQETFRRLLSGDMGDIYTRVVESCLVCLDERNEHFGRFREEGGADGVAVGL